MGGELNSTPMMPWIEWIRGESRCFKSHIQGNGRVPGTLEVTLLQCEGMLRENRENRHEGITEVVRPFDWSYSTNYKGTVRSSQVPFEPSNKLIPLDLLRQHDPILLYDEVMLYEDEMADNGITTYSCKVRVMPDRMLLLGRFFMRLDNVLIRIRDTRLFIEFGTGEVIREYVVKEEKYETIRQVRSTADASSSAHFLKSPYQILTMQGVDVPAHLRDPLLITDLLPIVDRSNESLIINSL